ncbi:MAG: hypothetical protein A2580_08975 [Hydrogenophilales bacterium RIFOXYD1_FULL_62_11]|nr:MAG: hypothetical protein A2580_08975 [Hydrogenophilales bacterium RIFOXYD1_FULL_62_11]
MTLQVGDPFEPRTDPARSIYRAFKAEAALRGERSFEEWNGAEIQAVHTVATAMAKQHRLAAPSLDDVRRAERYAQGSVDYGATWVWALLRSMRPVKAADQGA